MVTCVQLSDVGAVTALRLLRRPVAGVSGLRYSETLTAAPLSAHLLPRPTPGRVGLLSVWDDNAALDRFLTDHPIATTLEGGYRVRLRPTRVFGTWKAMGDIEARQAADDAPVAVLTLGRLLPSRAVAFLRASAAAERDALASPALLLASGLARPPQLVATFSLWRSAQPMRDYATQVGGGHLAATRQHAQHPFHSESAFIRYQPYDISGHWHPPGC